MASRSLEPRRIAAVLDCSRGLAFSSVGAARIDPECCLAHCFDLALVPPIDSLHPKISGVGFPASRQQARKPVRRSASTAQRERRALPTVLQGVLLRP
jgi:hypothetical protein